MPTSAEVDATLWSFELSRFASAKLAGVDLSRVGKRGGGLKPRCYYYAKDMTLKIALCVLCKISDRSSI